MADNSVIEEEEGILYQDRPDNPTEAEQRRMREESELREVEAARRILAQKNPPADEGERVMAKDIINEFENKKAEARSDARHREKFYSNKAGGGYVKKYAYGGGVRKAKFVDS